jgi:hypothetical protein
MVPVLCVEIEPWRVHQCQSLGVFANVKNAIKDYTARAVHSLNAEKAAALRDTEGKYARLVRDHDLLPNNPTAFRQEVDDLKHSVEIYEAIWHRPTSIPPPSDPNASAANAGWGGYQPAQHPPPMQPYQQPQHPQAPVPPQWAQHPQAPVPHQWPQQPQARAAPASLTPAAVHTPTPSQSGLRRTRSLTPLYRN